MLRRLKRLLGIGQPDEFALLRLGPGDRREVARFEAPVDPDVVEFEIDDHLEAGRYTLREINGGRWGPARWTTEIGDVGRADELEALRDELLSEVRRAAGDRPTEDFGQQLERGLLTSVISGELGVDEARELADLHARFEGGGHDQSEMGEPRVDFSIGSPQDLAIYRAIQDPENTISTMRRAVDEVLGDRGGAGADSAPLLRDALRRDDAVDDVDVDDDRDESAVRGSGRSPEEVAKLSEAFDGPRRDGLEGSSESDVLAPPLDPDEAAEIARAAAGD